MNPRSARTLLWVSAILAVIGSAVASPEAGVAALGLSALCALAPIAAGPRKDRIIGAILLIVALGSASAKHPAAKRQMEEYRGRATRGGTAIP